MDERVRRTVETYEENADAYAEIHGDRSVIADLVGDFLAMVDAGRDGRDGRASARDGNRASPEDGERSEQPRVLDVGPGPGWESATFDDHGFDVAAVDVTRSFLEQTRDRAPSVDVANGDMRSLPFADGRFDGLWVCASLLHVPREDVPGTLAEFERVLAPGGAAVVSVQRRRAEPSGRENERADGDENQGGDGGRDADERDGDAADASGGESVVRSPYDDDRRHFERYAPDEVRGAFEAAGFAVESVEADGDWVAVSARVD